MRANCDQAGDGRGRKRGLWGRDAAVMAGLKPFRSGCFLLGLFLASCGLRAAPIDTSALDPEWQELLRRMQAVERVAASFVESRSYAFRKAPKRYRGVFRKATDGSVSLAYTEPEPFTLHLGEGFAYYRKDGGAVRRIPESKLKDGTFALFPQLLNFDLDALAERYAISGEIEGERWSLTFEARTESEVRPPYASIRVEGHDTAVQRIELVKNRKQRVVIEMGDPVYPEFYLPEIKGKYFFTPASGP